MIYSVFIVKNSKNRRAKRAEKNFRVFCPKIGKLFLQKIKIFLGDVRANPPPLISAGNPDFAMYEQTPPLVSRENPGSGEGGFTPDWGVIPYLH